MRADSSANVAVNCAEFMAAGVSPMRIMRSRKLSLFRALAITASIRDNIAAGILGGPKIPAVTFMVRNIA